MLNQVKLDKIKLGIQQAVSSELLGASVDFERMAGGMILMQLRGYLWGEDLEPREIRHPRDWWQAFKERWAPQWALRRWPVIYTVHKITAHMLYPNLKIQLPKETYSLKMAVWDRDEPFSAIYDGDPSATI